MGKLDLQSFQNLFVTKYGFYKKANKFFNLIKVFLKQKGDSHGVQNHNTVIALYHLFGMILYQRYSVHWEAAGIST